MTTEQKVQRYDEALKRAKKLYEQGTITESLSYVFPELKESEDERIRKELLVWLKSRDGQTLPIDRYNAAITWLEKQGEQKPTDTDKKFIKMRETKPKDISEFLDRLTTVEQEFLWEHIAKIRELDKEEQKPQGKSAFEAIKEEKVDNATKIEPKDYNSIDPHFAKPIDKMEPKFHEGDWIVHHGTENIYQVVAVIDNQYQLKYGDNYTVQKCADVNRCARLWDITKDAKDGDLIYVSTEEKGVQAIFHEYINDVIFFHCSLCGDFVQGGYMPIGSVELTYPLQKTHYNRFFKKIKEAGYEWDAEKKELKKIEQNPWSEEDEYCINQLIVFCENCMIPDSDAKRCADWLKSLRPQNTWKPSDEQMDALHYVTNFDYGGHKATLVSLYEQLKKLKG